MNKAPNTHMDGFYDSKKGSNAHVENPSSNPYDMYQQQDNYMNKSNSQDKNYLQKP